jgi:Domain of unknown function (DUF6438)
VSAPSFLSRVTGTIAAAAVVSACSLLSPSPTPVFGGVPADFQIRLERGPCFGACPVYLLTVFADGTVGYEGRRFVEVEGSQAATLTPGEVEALVVAVLEADFFELADEYTVQATDLPSITLTVTMNGRTKDVYHYGVGCGTELDTAPPGLCVVESLLEQIPVDNGWVSPI